jgi:hypothetical protein
VVSIALATGCYSGAGAGDPEDDEGSGGSEGTAGSSADDGSTGDEPDEPFQTSKFECDPTQVPGELPLRRLSRVQYENAVRDLVAILVPADVDAVMTQVQTRMGLIPDDAPSGPDPNYGGLTRLDQSIFQETVEGSYHVGAAIGAAIANDSARLSTAAGACATDADTSNDAACVEAFVRAFGARALRRPLTDEDVAFYVDVAGPQIEAEDYADIVAVLLAAPGFLYFVEEGAGELGVATPLTAHEIAARLSFHFWQTIPDDELVAVADNGELLDDDVYAAQVERLFLDPRSVAALGEFYGEWLDNPHAAELDASVGMSDYDAFLEGFVPTADTRDNMAAELREMGTYYTHGAGGSFDEWFRSDKSFARTEDIASIYGVAPWDGSGEPPTLPNGREGVTTRALTLATGSAVTHPVLKGVYVRKSLLCDPVPPPPADAMAVAMGVEEAALGSRARAVAISEARGDCAGCHNGLINPLGFITEDYDGLGRHRTIEKVFDKQTGDVIAEVPIDTVAVPQIDPGDEREASSAGELNAMMLESEKPQACFARRYFRFTFGRLEDDVEDGCTLATLHQALVDGDDLGVVVRDVAMRPEFRTKTIEAGE